MLPENTFKYPDRQESARQLRIAMVYWKDAYHNCDNSGSVDYLATQARCVPSFSAGFLTRDDKDVVCLSQGAAPAQDRFRDHIFIPRESIVAMSIIDPWQHPMGRLKKRPRK
jgi:hypothetical protein